MLLPKQRNRTYGAESPLASADLNDVQDCIVGHKHDELELPVHASAFLACFGTPAFGGPSWTAGGAFQVMAPLRASVGSRITRCRFAYNRKNAGHLVVSLIKHVLATAALTTIATFDDAVAPDAITVHELAAINYTIATGEALALFVTVDGTSAAAGALVYSASGFADRL